MPGSDEVFAIGEVLAVMQRRLAAINANWNGQGPDLMTPVELEAFKSEILSFAQESDKLMFAVGGFGASIVTGRA
jgi:hypothetical protein